MAKKKEEVITQAPVIETPITQASITKESDRAVRSAEAERKALAQDFKKQKLVSVQISPLYQPYFGRVMTVTLNGTSVAVPVDGRTYKIPASFAEEVKIRIYNQDQLLMKKRRMSRVTDNFESSPGELQLF